MLSSKIRLLISNPLAPLISNTLKFLKLRFFCSILVGLQHDAVAEGVLPNTDNDGNYEESVPRSVSVDGDQTP